MKKLPATFSKNMMPTDDYALPRITLPHTALKGSKNWQNGKSYDVHMRVKQTESREGENSYKVTHVGSADSKPEKKSMTMKPKKRYMLKH